MLVKAAVFDLDGTIVDFNLDYKTLRAEVKRFLVGRGFPPSVFSINESVFGMLRKAEIYMRNNEGEGIGEIKKQVFSMADRYEMEAARQTSLVSGAVDVLNELRKMNLKMAIFTVNGEKATNYVLRTFRLKKFFTAVVTRERVARVKPDPDHLEAALKLLGVAPEEAVVVGDGVPDVESASALGAFAVGVTTGFSSPEQLVSAGADCLITSLIDLPVLIRKLNEGDAASDFSS